MMRNIYKSIFYITFLAVLSSCASMGGASTNDYFTVDKERLINHAKEALRDNNLRINQELEMENGSYAITAFIPEGRKFTSRESAINQIKVTLKPDGESGYRVSIEQPRKHAMARTASSVDYRKNILQSLNDLIPTEDVTGS